VLSCFSADGKYLLSGGEDDLVQVWSMDDRKMVAWGEGHTSWVILSLQLSLFTSYFVGTCYLMQISFLVCRLARFPLIRIGPHQIPMKQ
jgi:WD40 repeat protein